MVVEGDILFSDLKHDPDMSFMHNDFTESNWKRVSGSGRYDPVIIVTH